MEEDIKELKQEVKNFMKKYNCAVEIQGMNFIYGENFSREVKVTIRS